MKDSPSDEPIVTREQIAEKLRDWHAGLRSTKEISDWGENHFGVVEYDDYEGLDENSAAKEVLAQLDNLRMNLLIPEDALILLEFLATPCGEFAAGYELFQRRLSAIDYALRRQVLKINPIYAPFCV